MDASTIAGRTAPSSVPATAAGPALRRVDLGGVRVDLLQQATAVEMIVGRARGSGTPLAVISANLDHVHHFGVGGRWHGILEHAEESGALDVLVLLDGMPLVSRAQHLTGESWPRLAGSDLVAPVLDEAQRLTLSIGFLGGSEETLSQLRAGLAVRRPSLRVAGTWSPTRAELSDATASGRLAQEIRHAGVDVLVVGLGKPRQELWIAEYGAATGAKVLLAFGAVVDFLAGRVARAPEWVSRAGMEWSYRLAREPRRLARRYLVDGPEAYVRLRQRSGLCDVIPRRQPASTEVADLTVVFLGCQDPPADAVQLVKAPGSISLRMTATDGDAPAAVIDRVLSQSGPTRAALMVPAGVELRAGAVGLLWKRLWQDGVGAVVPRSVAGADRTVRNLGFEPTPLRVLADRLLGESLEHRPAWLTAVDRDAESYEHAHPLESATTRCAMVRREVVAGAAALRIPRPRGADSSLVSRVRATGWSTWYEPAAVAETSTR